MTDNWLLIVGSVLLVLAVIPATGIVLVWRHVDWRATTLGRLMHGKALAIAVVLWLSTIAATLLIFGLGRPVWFEIMRWGAFAYVDVVLWRQWFVYRRIVFDDAHGDGDATHRRDTLSS